jgi:hypothetical protein
MRRLVLLAVALLLGAGEASAVELQVRTSAGGVYDSNVGNNTTDENEEYDFSLEGSVELMLRSDPRSTDLTWEVSYRPRYEKFIRFSEFDDLEHLVRGRFEYALTDATKFDGRVRFRQTDRSSRRLPEDDTSPDPGDPETSNGSDRVDRVELNLGMSHLLTPRWTLSGNASYDLARYQRSNRSDYDAAGGVLSLSYALTRRQSLGGGLAYTHQALSDTQNRPGQTTNYGTAFLSWQYRITPLWRTNLRVGPAYIRSDDNEQPDTFYGSNLFYTRDGGLVKLDTCPNLGGGDLSSLGFDTRFGSDQCERLEDAGGLPNPDSELQLTNPQSFDRKGESLTAFAVASIGRTGEKSNFSLDFRRTQGENYGGRTSQIQNILGSSFLWQPTQRWTILARATWSLRTSATDTSQVVPVLVPAGQAGIVGVPANAAVLAVPNPNLNMGNGLPSTGFSSTTGFTGEARAIDSNADQGVDITTYTVNLRLTRSFSRRLEGFTAFRFRFQDNQGDFLGVGRKQKDIEVGLGVRYLFDAIQF